MNEENETLDPTNEFMFKRLFADPCNERLLLDLIRAVLGPSVDVICGEEPPAERIGCSGG